MKRVFAFAAMTLMPGVANATPVYLSCLIQTAQGGQAMNIQLNEEAGRVNYEFPATGIRVTKRAIFSPNSVSFNGFEIDRMDLSIQRSNELLASISNAPPVDYGRCEIDQRDRAF